MKQFIPEVIKTLENNVLKSVLILEFLFYSQNEFCEERYLQCVSFYNKKQSNFTI